MDNEDQIPPEDNEEQPQRGAQEQNGPDIQGTYDKARKLSDFAKKARGGGRVAGQAAKTGAQAASTGAGTTTAAGGAGAAAGGGAAAGAAAAGTTTAAVGATAAASTAAGGGAAAGAPVALIVIVVILIILFIILFIVMLMNLFASQNPYTADSPPPVSITKSGPVTVNNGEDIQYSINVSYPGTAEDIIITEPVPDQTIFVSATPQGKTLDTNGNPTTDVTLVKSVTWSLKELQGAAAINPPAATKDTSVYSESPYNLPFSTGASDFNYSTKQLYNLNRLGGIVNNYQSYLQTKANNNPKYTDPFLSVIFAGAILRIGDNNYFWDCADIKDINQPCPAGVYSDSWRVGFGAKMSLALNNLTDNFNNTYGNSETKEIVQKVGQAVIDKSGGLIAGTIFPQNTLSELISAAQSGDTAAQKNIAILLMDPDIAALSMAEEVAQDISVQDNWAKTLNNIGFSDLQTYANRMQEIAKQYGGSIAQPFSNSEFTIVLHPLSNDIYVVNQATAQLVGGVATSSAQTTTVNDDNCAGYYDLSKNPLNKNFGDPGCTMLANNNPTDKDKLVQYLRGLTPDYATWVDIVIPRESSFNSNAYNAAARQNTGGWGLFQMGNSSAYRGDVDWKTQAENAINYNKILELSGKKWCYWATADFHQELTTPGYVCPAP
jgi:hypothetical protein